MFDLVCVEVDRCPSYATILNSVIIRANGVGRPKGRVLCKYYYGTIFSLGGSYSQEFREGMCIIERHGCSRYGSSDWVNVGLNAWYHNAWYHGV